MTDPHKPPVPMFTEEEIRAVLDNEHHGPYSYVDCFCTPDQPWDTEHIITLLKEAKTTMTDPQKPP